MGKTKTLLMLILAGTVTFSVGLWFYSTKAELDLMEYVVAGLVAVVVVFSVIIGLKRMKNEKAGLPSDDELSQRIKEKAAGGAFLGSVYLWLLILIFFRKMSVEVAVGFGIIGMGLIFIVLYIYHSNKKLE